jgi:hypothetical protein
MGRVGRSHGLPAQQDAVAGEQGRLRGTQQDEPDDGGRVVEGEGVEDSGLGAGKVCVRRLVVEFLVGSPERVGVQGVDGLGVLGQ